VEPARVAMLASVGKAPARVGFLTRVRKISKIVFAVSRSEAMRAVSPSWATALALESRTSKQKGNA
jgi:hypothetical protein